MSNLNNASWKHRPNEISHSPLSDEACALNERTERGARNMMITVWALLAVAIFICGQFILGWKEVLGAIVFVLAVTSLFAWIGARLGR